MILRAHLGRVLGLLILLASVITGCTTEIYAPAATNPPPSEPFINFGQFRLEPVTLSPAFKEQGYNESARASIDRSLQASLGSLLASWDKGKGRTLVVQPYIEEIKFIGGAARFWAGAMAGSSAVVMRVTYRDQASGAEIATPVFYQHANAMGGAWTFGGTDNAMLARMAELVTTYTRDNFQTAVGGPTGAPADRIRGS
ncbi:MAG: hypothetical protein U1E42_14165 [Rhodospirillales bacterium]